MKYSFISDIHGADIKKVYKTIRPYVNLFIILGDLDRTRAAEQVNELLKNDPGVYFVPGNHDYSHINHELIYSGMMNKQEINSLMMWEEWDNSPELSKLISSSFDNSFKEKYPNYKGLAGRRISLHLENGEKMILMIQKKLLNLMIKMRNLTDNSQKRKQELQNHFHKEEKKY